MRTIFIWFALMGLAFADVLKVTVEQAEKMMEGDVQILDVRTEDEWDDGHLEGAVRVDYYEKDFHEKLLETLELEKPVLVYCKIGGRSAKAAKVMKTLGFTTIRDLDGGIVAWEKADKKVVK